MFVKASVNFSLRDTFQPKSTFISLTAIMWDYLIVNKDSTAPSYSMTSKFSLVILLRPLPDLWRPQQASHGCRLSICEIPPRWIFLCRHLSCAPSIGAHEHSRRPTASVKSVSYAALWFSDPNPPRFPTTTALLPLVPSYPNSQHVVIHSPFFLSALTPIWT